MKLTYFACAAFLLGCFLTRLTAQQPPPPTHSLSALHSLEVYLKGAYAIYAVGANDSLWPYSPPLQGNDVVLRFTCMESLEVEPDTCSLAPPLQVDFIPYRPYPPPLHWDPDGDGDFDLRDWWLLQQFWTGPLIPKPVEDIPGLDED